MSNAPGIIGQITRGVNTGIDIVKGVAGQIPNEKVRDKINGVVDKFGGRAEEGLKTGQQIAERVNNAAQDISKRAGAAYDAVKTGIAQAKPM